jgi:putative flippase GtrA
VLLFFGVNGVALLISAVALYVSHYGLGYVSILADNVATIIGIGVGTVLRYLGYKRWVFTGGPAAPATT